MLYYVQLYKVCVGMSVTHCMCVCVCKCAHMYMTNAVEWVAIHAIMHTGRVHNSPEQGIRCHALSFTTCSEMGLLTEPEVIHFGIA